MRIQNWLKLMILCVFCLIFTACGGSGSDAGAEETVAAPEPAAAEPATPETAAFSSGETQALRVREDTTSFFSFPKTTQSYTDDKGRELMVQTLSEPVFHAADEATREWMDRQLRQILDQQIRYGQELLEAARRAIGEAGEGFYRYSYHVSMETRRHDGDIISLIWLDSVYSGGAQPELSQQARNYDLNHLRVLSLSDVLAEGKEKALEGLVHEAVEEKYRQMSPDVLLEDYRDIISTGLEPGNLTDRWYFTGEGLALFYDGNALTDNAGGIVSVEIPYEALDGIIRPEYIPEPCRGLARGVKLSLTPEEGDWVYHADLGGGDTVYIAIEGSACSVQLSRVSHVRQTTVKKTMLFSASRLDSGTTIALTGSADPEAIYQVEYCTDGTAGNMIYIQGGKILAQLPEDQ